MTEHDFGFRTDFYTFSPETLAEQLADYEIRREVGKGSMGIVYEAIRRRDGQRVALKVLPPSLTLTDRALARFVKEGEVMSRIEHPGIVKVYEHGQKGRLHYFAMEFVDGITLAERLRVGPLPIRQASQIAADVAAALQFAHDRGVVHRDIKPGNLILAEGGHIKITDFGLARETGTGSFTESGAIVGTPMYMAPEQIVRARGDVDSRVDVYGVGATLFELVTGQPPFTAPTAQGVLKEVLERDPPRPRRLRRDLPEPLEAIILHCLAKRPSHRYGSCTELADDLRRSLAGERVLARRPSLLQGLARRAQARPLLTTLVSIIVILSTVGLLLNQDRRQRLLNQQIERAEHNYTKATSRQIHGFRQPSATQRTMYLETARDLATAVLDADPDNYRATWIRARVYHSLTDWPRALADIHRAEELLGESSEELLQYRIYTLEHFDDPASRQQLLTDLMALLGLNRSVDTICIVADYLLRMAESTPDGNARHGLLNQIERMLASVREPTGITAIARARLLLLRGDTPAARSATDQALRNHPGLPAVHQQAAFVYRKLGDHQAAQQELSMFRLLRGEEEGELGEREAPRKDLAVDTEALKGLLQGLGQLFGPTNPEAPDRGPAKAK